MFDAMFIGLSTAFELQNLMYVVLGCLVGTVIGMLPGLGPITAIALMIPVTYSIGPSSGMILMAGVYYGAIFWWVDFINSDQRPGRGWNGCDVIRWLSNGAKKAWRAKH